MIQARKNLDRININLDLRLKNISRMFSQFMIGIMFKVRFFKRYATSQGGDLYFREKNRVRR